MIGDLFIDHANEDALYVETEEGMVEFVEVDEDGVIYLDEDDIITPDLDLSKMEKITSIPSLYTKIGDNWVLKKSMHIEFSKISSRVVPSKKRVRVASFTEEEGGEESSSDSEFELSSSPKKVASSPSSSSSSPKISPPPKEDHFTPPPLADEA